MNDYIELFKYKVKGVQGMNTEVNLKLYYTRKRKKEKGKRQIKFTTIHNETILTFKTIMYIGL